MTPSEITALFKRFETINVGVIGDFALDLYFTLQTQTGERSLETHRDVFWGSRPRASLGAAGNVVQNLAALGVSNCRVIGCVGNDLFGREMQHLFNQLGVNTQHLHMLDTGWDTCLYTKPNLNEQEANRIDFGVANQLSEALFTDLITGLEESLADLDVVVINQQFANPLLSKERMGVLNELMARFPTIQFLADMRDVGTLVRGATLKVNTNELANFLMIDVPESPDLDWCVQHGNAFREQSGGPLLITRGAGRDTLSGRSGNAVCERLAASKRTRYRWRGRHCGGYLGRLPRCRSHTRRSAGNCQSGCCRDRSEAEPDGHRQLVRNSCFASNLKNHGSQIVRIKRISTDLISENPFNPCNLRAIPIRS